MTFKHNILIYYHRNTKKYNTLLILRFILDIQQRFIGAIFVLIVLIKESPLPVIIYWCYIVFFYLTKKDARQLKITNIFIAIVTLLQYSIIMMQQTVTDEQKDYKLISYIFKVLASKEPGAFEDNFKVLFTILGLNSPTQQTTLLYDSIPTVLFQITIFYYDFFLLFCAERLETVLLRIRTGIYYVLEDALGKKYYLINFQEWKDSAGKILLSIISLCTVRLIEISLVILLILNIFQAKPVWNFARLIILFMIYSNVAFRGLIEQPIVRKRLKFVLSLSIFYLWLRVVTISFITVLVSNFYKSRFLEILTIEKWEKFLLVIEFFMMEYISSIYFSEAYQRVTEKTIKKKKIRSNLIAQCITYDKNEEKLLRYIEGFSERISLENDISNLNKIIEE